MAWGPSQYSENELILWLFVFVWVEKLHKSKDYWQFNVHVFKQQLGVGVAALGCMTP